MKVEIVDDKVPEWKPLTLQITLETRDEALEMWHRLNIASGYFKSDSYRGYSKTLPSQWGNCTLWSIIDCHL